MSDDVRLEYIPIDELVRFPRNPKEHDIGALVETIRSPIGFVTPIIIDDNSGMIAAGHGRLDALFELYRQDSTNPPKRIRRDSAGRWLVPVNVIRFANEKELEAFAIADNRITILGGWDEAQLAENLQRLADLGDGWLELTGFDAEDLDDMLRNLEPQIGATEDIITPQYKILINCKNENEQLELFDKLERMGIKCQLLVS